MKRALARLHLVAPEPEPERPRPTGAALVSRHPPEVDPLMAIVRRGPHKGRGRVLKVLRLEPEEWSVPR